MRYRDAVAARRQRARRRWLWRSHLACWPESTHGAGSGRLLEGTGGLTADQMERFDRQIKLPEIGHRGQRRLLDSHVTVVGAGGLGAPVLAYLAGAGIGTLRIIDPDVVDLSNLQRQPIYRSAEAGEAKAPLAASFIAGLTPETEVETRQELFTSETARSLLEGTDIVVDATDTFDARYAINDAAIDRGIAMVSGAVYRWEAQIMTLEPGGACYRCVFPEPSDRSPAHDVRVDRRNGFPWSQRSDRCRQPRRSPLPVD